MQLAINGNPNMIVIFNIFFKYELFSYNNFPT